MLCNFSNFVEIYMISLKFYFYNYAASPKVQFKGAFLVSNSLNKFITSQFSSIHFSNLQWSFD